MMKLMIKNKIQIAKFKRISQDINRYNYILNITYNIDNSKK